MISQKTNAKMWILMGIGEAYLFTLKSKEMCSLKSASPPNYFINGIIAHQDAHLLVVT